MAKIRKGKTSKGNFTIIPNAVLQSKKLSLKARGLLAFCLSLPDDWNYSIEGLVKVVETDKKRAIISALKELEKEGYLQRRQLFKENGQFNGYEYLISDETVAILENKTYVQNEHTARKQQNQALTQNANTLKGKTQKANTQNQPQQNNNIQNTNYNNKNNNIYIIPTIEEVKKEIVENEYKFIDAEMFYNYYSGLDWRTKQGYPITNWKALVRNWNTRNKLVAKENEGLSKKARKECGYSVVVNEQAQLEVLKRQQEIDLKPLPVGINVKQKLVELLEKMKTQSEVK